MKFSRRLWLWIPWALFALMAALWSGYWFFLASQAENRIASWAREQEAGGARAAYTRIVKHGFPVLLRLEIQDLDYAPARGGWRAQTERIDLHLDPFDPEHAIFSAEAPIAIASADGATRRLDADALIASLRMRGRALAQFGVEADNLRLDDAAKAGVLGLRKLVLNLRPDPRAAGQYQLALEANNLTLPRPVRGFEAFGLDIDSLRAAIVIAHGAALLQGAPQDPLGPWREAGGGLRFEALAMHWGPLETDGAGAGRLDDARRLEGALALAVARPAPVLAALARGPDLDANAARALGLLAAGYALSGDDITLDLEARGGVLRLEGLPVRRLPPVY